MRAELPPIGTASRTEVLPLEYATGGRPERSHFRWYILALVFLCTTVNYVDRQVMNLLGPTLREMYHISKPEFGNISSAFALSYAFGQMLAGGLLDKIGTRLGYGLAILAWSMASMLHAVAIPFGGFLVAMTGVSVAGAALGFGVMRALLGVSEAPNFPAATKTLAEWFPRKERALAMGWVNAGTNVGILVAAMAVPWLTKHWGWQWAFIGTGLIGLMIVALWFPIYRRPHEHHRVSPAELAYINSDPAEPTTKIPWITLLSYPQTWAFGLGKFLTDAMWWFYMVWTAQFLKDRYGLDLSHLGLPLVVVYIMADGGSVGGGWLSSRLIKNGVSTNAARKTALLVSALCVVPIVFAPMPSNYWYSVIFLGMATAGHQGFSSNLYTLVSDTFPKRAVASVAGLGGTFGYVGASLFASATGYILKWTGDKYIILFITASLAYLAALGIIQLLMPRLEPALVDEGSSNR